MSNRFYECSSFVVVVALVIEIIVCVTVRYLIIIMSIKIILFQSNARPPINVD